MLQLVAGQFILVDWKLSLLHGFAVPDCDVFAVIVTVFKALFAYFGETTDESSPQQAAGYRLYFLPAKTI